MPEGFFNAIELADMAPERAKPKGYSCTDCGLSSGIDTPRMRCGGKGRKNIMVIGEAPGEKEDRKGTQFIGRAGIELEWYLDRIGVDLHNDCWKENACCCHPSENKTPTARQILACRRRLFTSIREKKPGMIILLGKTAVDSVIGNYWSTDIGAIGRWRGFQIPCHDLGAWLCPTFHPSYICRQSNTESAAPVIFRRDLKKAIAIIGKPLPKQPTKDQIHILDRHQARTWLKKLLKIRPPLLAFDFETTGLKPHARGHQIVCVSLCYRPDEAVAFWLDDNRTISLLRDVIVSDIPKVASNLKFEDQWSRFILKARPRNWKFDTMLGAHVDDNRQLITSIKFQAFVRLGVAGYENKVKPYLVTGSKNANAHNKLLTVKGWKDVLIYCGMDSLLEYLVAVDLIKILGVE